jgi:hypothetical protein
MKKFIFSLFLTSLLLLQGSDVKCQVWNMATGYSCTQNPADVWSYGRKWNPASTSFDLVNQIWSNCWWWMGNWGHGAPAIMIWSQLPSMWAKTNSNGLPAIRFTSPSTGLFTINGKFNGIDSRGVDNHVYIVMDDSVVFTARLTHYLDSVSYSAENIPILQGSHIDFIVQWAGGVYSEYGVIEVDATISRSCDLSITTQPADQSLHTGQTATFSTNCTKPDATYTWQTDLGFGFQDLTNAGQYLGVKTKTLEVQNLTLANSNQIFRCIVGSIYCADTTRNALLSITNAIGNIETPGIRVYPNPCSDHLTISVDINDPVKVTLFNIYGQMIHEVTFIKNTQINLDGFPSGLLFWELRRNGYWLGRGKVVRLG